MKVYWTFSTRSYQYLWIADGNWRAVISHQKPEEFCKDEYSEDGTAISVTLEELTNEETSFGLRKLRYFKRNNSYHYAWFENGCFHTVISHEDPDTFTKYQFVDSEIVERSQTPA
jgi:hypothetical protein